MDVLDIYVTRNGNNLKLKVKSEFSLSMGLMVINHSNPYIHSTTVLCDNYYSYVLPCVLVPGGWGGTRNAQTSGRPVKDQRSLKLPRTRVISYLTLSGQNRSHSHGQRIEYETRCLSGSVRTYKTPDNRFFMKKNCYTL